MAKRGAQGAGTIRKKTVTRGGKSYEYWEARVTVGRDPGTGKQVQRSFSGKTQKEVREKMQAAAVQVNEGTYTGPEKMTLAQWLEIWEREYLGDIKPLSVAAYHVKIHNHIIPALGAIPLQSLSPHIIQGFYNALSMERDGRAALSAKTVKTIHGVLHRALGQAMQNGYIRANPSDPCKLPRVIKKEMHPLDDAQIPLFLAAIRGDPYETLFTVALFTGMREGEILGLCWNCVDFEAGTILIEKQLQREKKKGGAYYFAPLKNDKSRTISPAPFVMQLLKAHSIAQAEGRLKAGPLWENSGLVFCNELGGHLVPITISRHFKRAVREIGAPDIRFHDLRHSYAVACIRAGDDIKTVQENLGHATAAFTLDVYGHVTKQMQQASAQRMQGYINQVLGM